MRDNLELSDAVPSAIEDLDPLEIEQMESAWKEFRSVVAAYELIIENEIDPERVRVLQKLLGYYLEDNK